MADNRITLELSNAELEGTPIRLADLVSGLGAVRRALRRTDDMVKSSLAEPMDWRIVHLSYASPVRVIVEPIPLPGYAQHSERVVLRFFDYAERIRSGSYDDVDARVMRAFMDLAKPVERGRLNLDIRNGSVVFTVPLGMSHGIKAALAPETTALGSVKGRLEFINLHGGKNVFRVYPIVGAPYVGCRFKKELAADAKRAIGRSVRVFGRLHYKVMEDFAHRVDAWEIDILPPDSDLPSLMNLRGIAPDATGHLSSEDFVRGVRSARQGQA